MGDTAIDGLGARIAPDSTVQNSDTEVVGAGTSVEERCTKLETSPTNNEA